MRIVLVTSEANYVRDNYRRLLTDLHKRWEHRLVGLVVIRTAGAGLFAKLPLFYAAGARNLAAILFNNACRAKFSDPFASLHRGGVPVIYTDDINAAETMDQLHSLNPDLIINARTRCIFSTDALKLPRLGCINIHHGILPYNRGTMCDLWALYEGRNPGFTIHEMTPEIDKGRILHVHEHTDWHSRDYFRLPYWASPTEARALDQVVEQIDAQGRIDGRPNTAPDEQITFRRDPTIRQIRQMRARNIVL